MRVDETLATGSGVTPGDVVGGRFEVQALVDSGGMGSVYRGRDRVSGDTVAIKVLRFASEKIVRRFQREAATLAALTHPAIVGYIAQGEADDGTPFLAMEWVDGRPLSKVIAGRALPVADVIAMGASVAGTLAWVHARGVVHRDIKPQNLMVLGDDLARVVLLDFGVARADAAGRITGAETLVGTPRYMAPEQARGERGLDARADLFSLGCVLYRCATGTAPFTGSDPTAVLAKVLFEEPARARVLRADLPQELDDLIAELLAKDADKRPRSADVVRERLLAIDARAALDGAPPQSLAITEQEMRLLSVVVSRLPKLDDEGSDPLEGWASRVERLRESAKPFGARIELLANGGIVAAIASRGSATEQAVTAARCALAMRDAVPDAAHVLATGRAELAGRGPVGEVIERAAELLRRRAPSSGMRIDETTASLLGRWFDVSEDHGPLLVSERSPAERAASTLTGGAVACVGRDRELAALGAAYVSCIERRAGTAVLLVGAPGIGKSRVLAEALLRFAGGPVAPCVLFARGESLRRNAPLAPLRPLLRRLANLRESDEVPAARRKLTQHLAESMGEQAAEKAAPFLCELAGVPADDTERRVRAARQDATIMYEQTARAWVDFVVSRARSGPTVLVLEDLHHVDGATLGLVLDTLRLARGVPLMLVVTAWPEAVANAPLLASHPDAVRIDLPPLSEDASRRLVSAALLAPQDSPLVARLARESGGNALYLEELVRAHASGRRGSSEAVVAMVQARLEALDPDARLVLRAASVLGDGFTEDAVRSMLGSAGADAVGSLRELVLGDVLSAFEVPGGTAFVFRHSLVRDAAYSMLTESDRERGHKLAARWLEARGHEDPVLIAEHYERGASTSDAARLFVKAAHVALDRSDTAGAVAFAERAIACGVDPQTLATLRLRQAEAHNWRGDHASAEVAARAAMELARRPSEDYFRAGTELVVTLTRQGKLDQVVAVATTLLSAEVDRDTAGALSISLARAASALCFSKPKVGAGLLDAMDRTLARFEQGELLVLARADEAHANAAIARGDLEAYIERAGAAADAFDVAGAERVVCMLRVNLAYAKTRLGLAQEAASLLEEALAQSIRLGAEYVELAARHNLGRALALAGRVDRAIELERTAITMADARGDVRVSGASRAYLAEALLERDVHAAELEAREAARVLSKSPPNLLFALAVHARALLACGRSAEGLEAATNASHVLDELGTPEEGEALVRWVLAQALFACGRREQASAALVVAIRAMLTRAHRLVDPVVRASFLEGVPEHASIHALALAWGVWDVASQNS